MITHYKIEPFWDDEYQKLQYHQERFNDPAQLAYWHELGYQNVATGSMCDMRSPQPSWNTQIVSQFVQRGWHNVGTSYYRMDPGSILPAHRDLYKKYIELFDLAGQESRIRRAIIFLQDWQPGHYAEYEDEPFVKWRAGHVVEWVYDTLHMAANLGTVPRYTLQVTGWA
jgi:hypothetical protein